MACDDSAARPFGGDFADDRCARRRPPGRVWRAIGRLAAMEIARCRGLQRCLAPAAALLAVSLLTSCDSLSIVPPAGPMAVARLEPRNASTVRGTISFTQRGDRVWISAHFTELWPGAHSLYIHAVGNCSSPNAASAGPVWDAGAAKGGKRSGDLPQIFAGTEGHAELDFTSPDLSVGTGQPNDVIGHSVVVHSGLDPDPRAEFGVRNGWLACGVIQPSAGFNLRDIL